MQVNSFKEFFNANIDTTAKGLFETFQLLM